MNELPIDSNMSDNEDRVSYTAIIIQAAEASLEAMVEEECARVRADAASAWAAARVEGWAREKGAGARVGAIVLAAAEGRLRAATK